MQEKLNLTKEWDKTFPQSTKVSHRKVTFCNRYGITLAADLYEPKDETGKLPAIAVCGPFGAVKEQCSGLYAQTLAERGFLTVPLIRPLPAKAAELREMLPPPTSTPKIFRRRLTFLAFRTMLTQRKSELSVSAAGAEWH